MVDAARTVGHRSKWDRPPLGRLWRAFLFRSGDGVTQLRRWARWSWWASHREPAARRQAVRELAMFPYTLLRDARAAVAVHGASVAARHRISPARQLLDLCWLRAVHGIRPATYYRFQLFLPERRPLTAEYVQAHEAEALLRVLMRRTAHDCRRLFIDKRFFDTWCGDHGLPSVPTLAEFEHDRLVYPDGGRPTLPAADLFSKPTNWQSGRGVQRWLYDGNGSWIGADGRTHGADSLLRELSMSSRELDRPILLQRLLRNHASLAPLTAGGLCTVRVVTIRPAHGAVEALLAVYRMPVGDTPADNFDLGGLAAPVDMATGRLGAAVRKRGGLIPDSITHHPDTGAVIPGHALPHWAGVVQLALTGHGAIDGPIPVVGWDVAILDDGPVLLEANNVPCTVLAQLPSGRPLGLTAYPGCIAESLRRSFSQ
jgi:hypothetical protein